MIVEAQFAFAPDTSFHDAALATVASAQRLYGSSDAHRWGPRSPTAEFFDHGRSIPAAHPSAHSGQ